MTTSEKKQFTPGEISRFKESFFKFDFDGDGTIPTKNLGAVMKGVGINLTEIELRNLLDEADINQKGPIEFDEFLNLITMKSHLQEDTSSEK